MAGEIIGRHIGFFGKMDTYSRYCRPCLPNHAEEDQAQAAPADPHDPQVRIAKALYKDRAHEVRNICRPLHISRSTPP